MKKVTKLLKRLLAILMAGISIILSLWACFGSFAISVHDFMNSTSFGQRIIISLRMGGWELLFLVIAIISWVITITVYNYLLDD